MDLVGHLDALAAANRHGWAFLAGYGAGWLLCSLAWTRLGGRPAAYVTLFQGLVSLPVALALTALAPGPPRPSAPTVDLLSVMLATGQLLGLPVVAYLVMSGRDVLVPLGMVALLVVHLAPYSWLYRTPLYVVVGAVVPLVAVTLMRRAEREGGPGAEVGAGWVCRSTGVLLVTGAGVAAAL